MQLKKRRKYYTADEKVAILRRRRDTAGSGARHIVVRTLYVWWDRNNLCRSRCRVTANGRESASGSFKKAADYLLKDQSAEAER